MNVLVVNDISWDNFAIVARRLNTRSINPNHRINYFYGKDMKYISNICNQNLFTLIRRPLVQENLKDLILDSLKYTIITIQDDYSLKFDNTFLDIPLQERQSITQELKKLFINDSSKMLFPTIVFRNKIYNGLPDDETLKKLFKL